MTTLRQAAQQALECIERLNLRGFILADFEDEVYAAIAALKAALEQPEQEPVAWMTINAYGEEDDIHYENPEDHLMEGWTYKPLYTHPPQTQQAQSEPLEYWNAVEGWVKIDEVREHFDSVGCGTIYKTAGEDRVPVYAVPPPCPTCEALARTVEAKLKERNNG